MPFSLGLSPSDDKWEHQQREGGCNNPWWRKSDEYGSLTVPVARQGRWQQVNTHALRQLL
jgi:hypothetical protein